MTMKVAIGASAIGLAGSRLKRQHFVDSSRYPGHVLRGIRSSTKRQARECARRRRQAERAAQRGRA